MTAVRRLTKELNELKDGAYPWLRDVTTDSGNMFHWYVVIAPKHFPYNQVFFKLEMFFRHLYPFIPPKVAFITPIYHPNVDVRGLLYLPCIAPENWKPRTSPKEILESLLELLTNPYLLQPMREDLAAEFYSDSRKFMKNALEHSLKHGERAEQSRDNLRS